MVSNQKLGMFAVSLVALFGCRAQHASTLTTLAGVDLTTMIVIPEGIVESSAEERGIFEAEVREQLQFLVGQFRAQGGVVDLSRLEIDVGRNGKQRLGRPVIEYVARVPITWQGEVSVPRAGAIILPLRGDGEGRKAFHAAFASTCRLQPSSASQYWFNFAIGAKECQLSLESYDKTLAISLPYVMSPKSTGGLEHKPNYAAIWADKSLQIVSIFDRDFSDQGGLVTRIHAKLQQAYGPATVTEAKGVISHTFSLADGKSLLWHVIMRSSTEPILENKLMDTADVVFDTSSMALTAMFERSQAFGITSATKLYVITGRGTFAYIDRRILGTPSHGSMLDVLVQAVPSFKAPHSETHIAVIDAMVAASQPYSELVPGLERLLPTAVAGLEDNSETQPAKETDLFFGFF